MLSSCSKQYNTVSYNTNLIRYDHVETDGKSYKEEEEDDKELHKCGQDVSKHDDVDTKSR